MGPALAIAGIASSLLGAGMSAYSQMQSANYNAQVARNNQIMANQNASISLQQGQQAEENKKIQTGEEMARLGAGLAAEGVNPNTGSAENVRSSLAETGDLDALTIRYNSNLNARNLKYEAGMYGAQAQLDTSQGQWGMTSSLLGGASSVASKWLSYQQFGNLSGPSINPIVSGGSEFGV